MVDTQNWTTERIVRLVALGLLVVACLQIILPFLVALTWAAIISITVWPAFMWLTARFGNRPVLAACLCSLALFVVLVLIPTSFTYISPGHIGIVIHRAGGGVDLARDPVEPAAVAAVRRHFRLQNLARNGKNFAERCAGD